MLLNGTYFIGVQEFRIQDSGGRKKKEERRKKKEERRKKKEERRINLVPCQRQGMQSRGSASC
ncbi:MAG: hypothetical protein AN482_11705 [Anabaena sp. LE011-02]|nr:MAG: hypothetical protein AN482_11705 [Anabaena sp. LE011-02]